jgi:signal transduction histidine kinase
MDYATLQPGGQGIPTGSAGNRIKVLLAVCDPEARALARTALSNTSLFLDIDETDTQQATLQALLTSRYDCAFIECVKSGTRETLLELLARIQHEIITTPVVALTEAVPEETALEVLKAGAVDYIVRDRITPYALAQSILRATQVARAPRVNSASSQQLIRDRDDAIVARDAALEASRVKSQVLAFITHELKTPLNAIVGYADLLEEELADTPAQELTAHVHKIRVAGNYLGRLIADLLDVSKLEAGKLLLLNAPVDLAEVVSHAASLTQGIMRTNGNTLTVEISPDLPPVETDDLRLRQILVNLLSNAAKFTSHGQIKVHVECYDEGCAELLYIAVSDTGGGIPADQLARLFEPYHQVHTSEKHRQAGTGLGLSLSRLLCWAMGGDILVESTPGTGSTFTVLLPINPSKGLNKGA